MKIIAFILSLIVFSMAMMPCADTIEYALHGTTTHADCSGIHEHSPEENDGCTPFCNCDCCGVSITIPELMSLEEVKEQVSFLYSVHYSFNYSFQYTNSVWHPPSYC